MSAANEKDVTPVDAEAVAKAKFEALEAELAGVRKDLSATQKLVKSPVTLGVACVVAGVAVGAGAMYYAERKGAKALPAPVVAML